MVENKFRQAIESGRFAVTVELIPGRGANTQAQQQLFSEAVEMWKTDRIDAISITDLPGGNSAILPDAFAADLLKEGVIPLVHLSCKDRNRNQFESQFYAMQRNGVENLLCMSGDHPTTGWNGQARPVFDLDPVTLCQMIESMNNGIGYPTPKGTVIRQEPANFFPGAVFSPFKWTEGETMLQLSKVRKKVQAGAKFLISQVGYSARKMQEFKWLMEDIGLDTPLIANIFVLGAGPAAFMNRGGIPGCDVSDDFLAVLRAERDNSDDKGEVARLTRAAEQIAVAKGLGYAGVHIGGAGIAKPQLEFILDKAAEFESEWQNHLDSVEWPLPNRFWAYEENPTTKLNTRKRTPLVEDRFKERKIRGNFRLSHRFHKLVFVPGTFFNKIFIKVTAGKDKKKGALRKHGLEHMGKVFLYDCMDCGDCGLWSCGYTCPMTQCPKCQRNGPCGGSKDGFCEVYPGERYCIWYKAYHRYKHYDELHKLDDYIVPPNQWAYWQKSPWSSMAVGRDSYARREWMPGVTPDKEFLEGPHSEDAPKVY